MTSNGDYGHDLEFGVFIEPSAQIADQVVALSVLADGAGYDLVTFNDHPYNAGFLDSLTLMSFVAARTDRVRLAANVTSLPLRPPAVLARALASLDNLSHGRAELGIGAGVAWDAIETMGGRRLDPGDSVEALEEGIQVIRELWDLNERGAAQFEGKHYRLAGALPGPPHAHDINIWVGAFKPRMLRLIGRLADGWWPTLPALKPGDLAAGNAIIDAAAEQAGRDPRSIRRLLNLGTGYELAGDTAAELARFALEDGIGTFIVSANEPRVVADFASEVVPRVREVVEQARRGEKPRMNALSATSRSDVTIRHSDRTPWEDSTRPHLPPSGAEQNHTDVGRHAAQSLLKVHDLLRSELSELRDILQQVRDKTMRAGDARAALNEMVLRQNDWTLGAACARYCGVVTQHHGVEDAAVFPHLANREPQLTPVIERLTQEHLVIHDAIQDVDQALVTHMAGSPNHDVIQDAIDYLTDALLSHLGYEEEELMEPVARLGLYPGQVPERS
jgi:alkanesulfonate monooxygenase SsuD/methylene tetrahydromethanopterin reductase-like flavin-dependent oxidoreductase (luciferase family)